jgi:hypothetical protein
MSPKIHSNYVMSFKDFEEEVEFIKKTWRDTVLHLISELPDYLEICKTSKDLVERFTYIFHINGKKLTNIYNQSVVAHLPTGLPLPCLELKHSGII